MIAARFIGSRVLWISEEEKRLDVGHWTEDVWATPHVAGKNVVRQLLVPAYDNVDLLETDSGLEVVSTPFGQWPVAGAADLLTDGPLVARLPVRRSRTPRSDGKVVESRFKRATSSDLLTVPLDSLLMTSPTV